MAIQLNPREKQFKELLLGVASHIDRSVDDVRARAVSGGDGDAQDEEGAAVSARAGVEPVVVRWAGGWVRDKLLGIESHDIDVAINNMTGEAFTRRLVEYCASPANLEKHGISPGDVGNLHTVAANPDKSKHLETVATKIFGIEVDFVNLRRETYAEHSRTPQMEFGTAREDAVRRDATINALFYNLHLGEVEDFTSGIPDLEAKVIRTPMEPLQTFLDDPLRVLRLVRFATRLGFTIDPAAERTMSEPRVLQALKEKISRERVGIEVEKMLKHNNARDSLHMIDRLGLYHAVFTDPSRADLPCPDISKWSSAYECLAHLGGNRTPGSIYNVLVRTEEDAYFAWVLAAVLPWEALDLPEVATKGTHTLPVPTLAAQGGIKAGNKLSDIITATHRNRPAIEELKALVCRGERDPALSERDRFGMAIRAWDTRTGNWRLQVLALALLEVMRSSEAGSSEGRDAVLAGWQKFLDYLAELDVLEAPSVKRLIDGKKLSAALGVKPGKWMTQALDVCMAWQLRNPGVTDVSGAIEEVRRRKDELGIT